jgi:nucleoside-diphosphate-sugar epimerase
MKNVLITGGAGYVGAVLVPKLLNKGYNVTVLDLMIYGEEVFDGIKDKSNLKLVKGDMRDQPLLKKSLAGINSVIHLACISNDPSFDLNPDLGKSINLDSFRPLVEISKECGADRFIYASSSSVYGVKDEPDVHEKMELEPLTDYSKFKADCEEILKEYQKDDFTTVTIRPATVCGYSPRQRLDVIVNILSNHAFHNRQIKVFGGSQKRPNIHIQDMTDLYCKLLEEDKSKIAGQVYNAGYENHTVTELANMTQKVMGEDVAINFEETDDLRSYHVSSKKIADELGFVPSHTIGDAIQEMKDAFEKDLLPNSFEDKRYFNIKTMLDIDLK